MKVEELKKPEKKQEYQDKLKEAYDRVKEGEAGELEEEWGLMKESLVGHASDVCGKRFVGGCMRKGSEWWNEGVKVKVEEKKRAFEEWLQCKAGVTLGNFFPASGKIAGNLPNFQLFCS